MKEMGRPGYTLLIALFAMFTIALGLLIATPLWFTQVQRELEAELIFRGQQYVEAVRLYQAKFPGRFPENFEVLQEEKCLRRLYKDPMTEHGEWNVILNYGQPAGRAANRPRRRRAQAASRQQQRPESGGDASPQKIMIAPFSALPSIDNPQIIGVVSSSVKASKKIYLEQVTYDKWLFFFGQDPKKLPEIIYYGQEDNKQE